MKTYYNKTTIRVNKSVEAQSLYEKLRVATESKTPLEASTPLIFTERKDGVMPGYNIRTDRWDLAQQSMDGITRSTIAKRDSVVRIESAEAEAAEPVNGTDN